MCFWIWVYSSLHVLDHSPPSPTKKVRVDPPLAVSYIHSDDFWTALILLCIFFFRVFTKKETTKTTNLPTVQKKLTNAAYAAKRSTRSTTWRSTCTLTMKRSLSHAKFAEKGSVGILIWKNMCGNCTMGASSEKQPSRIILSLKMDLRCLHPSCCNLLLHFTFRKWCDLSCNPCFLSVVFVLIIYLLKMWKNSWIFELDKYPKDQLLVDPR